MGKKEKEDLRKNPDKVDTSMGEKYLKEGRVVIIKKEQNEFRRLFKQEKVFEL